MNSIQGSYFEIETILFAPDNPTLISVGQRFDLVFFAIDNMGVVPGVRFTLSGIDGGPASGVTDGLGRCILNGFSFLKPGKRIIRAHAVINGVSVHSAYSMTVKAKAAVPSAY